ncbi:MAG: Esa1p-associated factor [Peltula sp. TS41687]|nr:MAG: Esa1p-associated factor [Peltula sp. TS41687]
MPPLFTTPSSSSPSYSQSSSTTFVKDERVYCFHMNLMYEAKIVDTRPITEGPRKGQTEHRVHYKGWKTTWDDWVPHERLRKFTDENRELAQTLKKEMDAVVGKSSKDKRKSTASMKKAAGSDLSSTRASEERHSSVQTQPAPRGQKRARDSDIEKVSRPASRQPSAQPSSSTIRTGQVSPADQSDGESTSDGGLEKGSTRPSASTIRPGQVSPADQSDGESTSDGGLEKGSTQPSAATIQPDQVPSAGQSDGESTSDGSVGNRSTRRRKGSVSPGQKKARRGTPSSRQRATRRPDLSTVLEEEELESPPPAKKPCLDKAAPAPAPARAPAAKKRGRNQVENEAPNPKRARMDTTSPSPATSRKRARSEGQQEEEPEEEGAASQPATKRPRILLKVRPRNESVPPPVDATTTASATTTATAPRGRGRAGPTRGGATARGRGRGNAQPDSSAQDVALAPREAAAPVATVSSSSHRGKSNGSRRTRNAAKTRGRPERNRGPPSEPNDVAPTAGYVEGVSIHPMHRSASPEAVDENADLLQEGEFLNRPSVRLIVPDLIKGLLVDDWENVTKNLQLVPLPSAHPVNEILEDYFAEESTRRRRGSPEFALLEEMIQGLRDYFERAIGKILLYRFEREQLRRARELWVNPTEGSAIKGPADVYGAEHLSRLLSSLPELIAQTSMRPDQVAKLRRELITITHWLSRNAARYFTSDYENTDQEYIEKARGP